VSRIRAGADAATVRGVPVRTPRCFGGGADGSGGGGRVGPSERIRPRSRWITPGIAGAFDESTPRAFIAGPMSCGSEITGRNRSPTRLHRLNALSMRKFDGDSPPLTSVHRSGVETVAPASRRI